MDCKICFEMIILRCRGNTGTMCEFHDPDCNGLGDMWWTDKCTYFSSIDVFRFMLLLEINFILSLSYVMI